MSIMKKAVLAATLAATAVTASAPAMARDYDRGRDNTAAIAIGAGIVGLAIGAIAASDNNDRHRDRRYRGDRYRSGDGYYYRDGYYNDRSRRGYSRDYRDRRHDDRRDGRYDNRRYEGRYDRDGYYSRRGY